MGTENLGGRYVFHGTGVCFAVMSVSNFSKKLMNSFESSDKMVES